MTSHVVYCPAYGLTKDGSRLTSMNQDCTEAAIREILAGRADHIIFSTAYPKIWATEARLKTEMAKKEGVSSFTIIPEVTNTYTETQEALKIIKKLGSPTLIVVAEKYHIKRVVKIFHQALPEISIIPIPVLCKHFEQALEPSLIKSMRAGYKPLWILWNYFFYLLTPFLSQNIIR